jgi:Peptidase family M23
VRRLAVLLLCALALPVSVAQAWTWPVDGPVLRPFVFDRAHPYAAGQHRGVDLGAPAGAPVLAPSEGVVKFAGTVPTGGKTVSIETPTGLTATLVHLGSYVVKRGQAVAEGAVVGAVGPSGVTELTEPFVYFGVRTTSDPQGYLDPLAFLPARPALPAVPPVRPVESPVVVATEPGTAIVQPQPVAEPSVAAPVEAASAPAAVEMTAAPVEHASTVASSAQEVHGADARPEPVAAVEPAGGEFALPAPGLAASASQPARVSGSSRRTRGRIGAAVRRSVALPRAASSLERQREPMVPRSAATPDRSRSTTTNADHGSLWRSRGLTVALAGVGLLGLALAARRDLWAKVARIIMTVPETEHVDRRAEPKAEDPGRTGLALRVREAAPGPRGRVRRARGHLRALPPSEGERRPDGEWNRRTWDAGHGHGRSRGRLAA